MKQPQLSVDLAPHEQQLGKYRLVVKLGQGGMGTVYLALSSGLGAFKKLLVVKELRHDLPWRESSLSMFMDEAQLAARLDHPNVLQTFEAGEADNRYFLAMEYLDGQPLSAIIDQGLPLELHVYILCEVLQGLQYAHDLTDYDGTRLHVVHRDVSPQNVFVTYHGQVKVVDFGVAKANNGSNVTSPGVFKGKFAYAAPEQLLSRPVDGRCDVFAVGVMLWEAIAGRRFGVPKPTVDAFRVRTQGLEPRIAQVSADVDPLLAEICDHALAIDPLQRIASAEVFRARLHEWLHLQGEHIQTKQLAAYMTERFSAERAERRRVIERAMIDAGASQSVIATLPRELYDRESGMAAKVDAHSELSSASGISSAPAADEHASTRGPALPMQAQQLAHTQGSARLPEVNIEPVSRVKPPFRPGSAVLLVCVAAAVFVATYQVSRRVTEQAPSPQLRATHPRETSRSSALRAAEPAAHSSNALPTMPTSAAPSTATEPAHGNALLRGQARDVAVQARDAAHDSAAQRPASTRDTLATGATDSTADPSDRSARRSREALTTGALDSTSDSTDRSPRRSRDALAVGAADPAGDTSERSSRRSHDAFAAGAAESAGDASERFPRRSRDSLVMGTAESARDPSDRSARRAAAARDAPPSATDIPESAQSDRTARRGAAMRESLAASAETSTARDHGEHAPQRGAATREALPVDASKVGRDENAALPRTAAATPATVPADLAAGNKSKLAADRTSPTSKTRASSAATRADPSMGSDLRQLRSNGPMRIDVEDPYR